MKVMLVNGSPHEHGCTYTALSEVANALQQAGIETELFWIGRDPIGGCTGCGGCRKLGKCVQNDSVNAFLEKASSADGYIFGSPVHYAAMAGNMTSFMDRVFYCAGRSFRFKPAAGIVSARRSGTTASYDQLNKYFGISQMPIVSSRYWNMVHGNKPEEVRQDLEGMQCMRMLGRNMAYYLKCIEAGKAAGIEPPEQEEVTMTNFVR